MTAEPLDCGHPMTNRDASPGAGRAIDADGRTYCYPCAGAMEAAAFLAADTYTAYDVAVDGRDAHHGYTITTWTGHTLAHVHDRWTSRGGFGSRMVHLRAVAPDGSRWYGRHSTDCECVTLHRSKGNKA